MIVLALVIIAFIVMTGAPVVIGLAYYKDGMGKIVRERDLLDRLAILKIQEDFRQRDEQRWVPT